MSPQAGITLHIVASQACMDTARTGANSRRGTSLLPLFSRCQANTTIWVCLRISFRFCRKYNLSVYQM